MQRFIIVTPINNLLLNICNIAIEAGLVVKTYYNSNISVFIKEDKSPVTKADLASNEYIIKSLCEIDSNIPILSEESFVDWNIRKNWSKYWLVDPLDGTKEFIKQNGEFTINIALIENNQPILGVIYVPILSMLYYASKKNGSYKLLSNDKIYSLSNSTKIHTSSKNQSDKYYIFGSRSHMNKKFENWVSKNFINYELIKKGSSLKFCELAEGKADLYPRFGPTSEWDTAAGHVILEEAGGKIESIDHKKIFYNLSNSVINPSFIASCQYSKNV